MQAIERLKEAKLPRSDQPALYLKMQVAQYRLQMGELTVCRDAIQNGKQRLEELDDVRAQEMFCCVLQPKKEGFIHYEMVRGRLECFDDD